MCCNDKYQKQLQILNSLYDYLNDTFFESALSKPVITIQLDSKSRTFGWFTPWESWKCNEETAPELNLTANFLDRPPIEIIGTLLHEMCHQYAYVNKIQDTSRSGTYHNTKFRDIAESHGLILEKDSKYGWIGRQLTDVAQQKVACFLDKLLVLKRLDVAKKSNSKSSSTRKYICPVCGLSVRATKEVNISCLDCEEKMILEEN